MHHSVQGWIDRQSSARRAGMEASREFSVQCRGSFACRPHKLKFHESSFLARILVASGDFPVSLPRAYLTGRPALCCGVVLPVFPCVVLFSKFHGPKRTICCRHPRDEVTSKMLPWNFSRHPAEALVHRRFVGHTECSYYSPHLI